ncbi:MAG: SBBP repeat-containing protein [Deltaproteobacteria bacterium]|nr:SBBP repeat-containing protein [Deltaproteobacteria bacterium]
MKRVIGIFVLSLLLFSHLSFGANTEKMRGVQPGPKIPRGSTDLSRQVKETRKKESPRKRTFKELFRDARDWFVAEVDDLLTPVATATCGNGVIEPPTENCDGEADCPSHCVRPRPPMNCAPHPNRLLCPTSGSPWSLISGSEDQNEVGMSLELDASGNLYTVSREGYGAATHGIVTRQMDSCGTLIWEKRIIYIPPTPIYTEIEPVTTSLDSIGVDGSGNSFVIGIKEDLPGGGSGWSINGDGTWVFVRGYNFTGDLIWEENIDQVGNSAAIEVDCAGNVYVAGWSVPPVGSDPKEVPRVWVRKYKLDGTGTRVLAWESTDYDSKLAHDYVSSMTVDGAGNLYVLGWTHLQDPSALPGSGLQYPNALLLKYSPDGALLQRAVRPSIIGKLRGHSIGPDGNLYATTASEGAIVEKISSTDLSHLEWITLDDISPPYYPEEPIQVPQRFADNVAFSSEGNMYVTGWKYLEGTSSTSNKNYPWVSKLNPPGTELLWENLVPGVWDGRGDALNYNFGVTFFDLAVDSFGNSYSIGGIINHDPSDLRYRAADILIQKATPSGSTDGWGGTFSGP